MAALNGTRWKLLGRFKSCRGHQLQAADPYGNSIQDAHEQEDVVGHIRQCQQHDNERALRYHALLGQLTSDGT